MRKEISQVFWDLSQGKNIENYLIVLLALIVAVLSITGYFKEEIIASVTLAALSLVIYSQIKIDRTLQILKTTHNIQGISSFYPNRINLPTFADRLSESKEEIAITGLQLTAIVHSYLPVLEERALNGCKIKLLMMSPVSTEGELLPWVDEVGQVILFKGLRDILRDNLAQLKSWLDGISNTEAPARIKIKLSPTIPTATMVLIDKDTDKGSIKVETVLYQVRPSNRPSFILARSDSIVLYDQLVESFNRAWDAGIDIDELTQKL